MNASMPLSKIYTARLNTIIRGFWDTYVSSTDALKTFQTYPPSYKTDSERKVTVCVRESDIK